MHPSDGIFPICEYEKLKATNHKAVGLGLNEIYPVKWACKASPTGQNLCVSNFT